MKILFIIILSIGLLVTVYCIAYLNYRAKCRKTYRNTPVLLLKNRKVVVALHNYIGPVIIDKVFNDIFNGHYVVENHETGGSYKITINGLHWKQIIG